MSKPRLGAVTKARRLAAIPELLKLKPRTTHELAVRFGVPIRSIQRDLETLREEGLGIEEVRRGLYQIPASPSSLSAVEALAVHAATRLLYHHALARNRFYQSALEKLAAMLPEPARSIAFKSAEEVLSRSGDDRALEMVARAWFEGRVLAFDHLSPAGSGRPRPKELEVYFVEISRDNLAPYAIGYERSWHRGVLTFKLSRMRNTRLLDDTYTIPEDFDPRAYLTNAWGIIGSSGGPPVTVRLRFAREAAYRLKEGGYPNLVIEKELAGGGLEVAVQTGTDGQGFPREILPWVLGWGPRVEVLEPLELQRRWLEEARQVAALFDAR